MPGRMGNTPDPRARRLLAATVVAAVAAGGAAWLLAGRGGDADALLASAKPTDRVRGIEALHRKGDEDARQRLFQLCSDKDAHVAVTAAWALGEQRVPANREMLERLLADQTKHPRVRGTAAAALGRFRDCDPAILVDALSTAAEPPIRVGAAKGLLALRNHATLPAVVRALEDGDENVRYWALEALHNMVVRRFGFDPRHPPDQQREVLEQIRAYLKEAGVAAEGKPIDEP